MNDELPTAQPKPQMLGLAVVSLVLSCLALFLFLPGCLFSGLGVACGHAARRQIRKDPDFCGDRLALAGLIIGYIHLTTMAIIVVVSVTYVFLPIWFDMIRARWS